MTRALFLIALAVCLPLEQKAPVDFSGVYKPNSVLSKALTVSKGLEWRVAGAGIGGGAPTDADLAKSTVSTINITQTATHLVIDDRLNTLHRKSSLALDGSESTNVNGLITSKSRSTWKGSHLVTTGVNYLEAATRTFERPFTSTRILAPDGNIHIENRITIPEQNVEHVSWAVLERQK